MRKRILAGLLAFALALSLLPVSALASTGVAGVANVYTLADIKAATQDGNVNTIRLMNDIDASKETYEFDEPQRFDAPAFCNSGIRQGIVFDGNGHTIYNLKSGLWRSNYGTIRNLNISIHDTESDSTHLSDFGAGTSGIEYFGIVRGNQGVIENCNVTMQIDQTVSYAPQIGGIALFNSDPYNENNGKIGVIRNCIANLKINIGTTDVHKTPSIGGISQFNSEDARIEHCLVLGSFTASTSSHFVGLTRLQDETAYCIDSAFAMDQVIFPSGTSFSPGFSQYDHLEHAENCRVANDLSITSGTLQYTIEPAGPGGYTLDTRENILKDWDLSYVPGGVPSNGGTTTDPKPSTPEIKPPAPTPDPEPTPEPEPEPEKNPFPEGTANFYYSASDGTTRQHYFYYNDLMFYSFDETYRYQPLLATASLCLALSAFSNQENLAWNSELPAQDHRRAYNVERLYETLGYTNAEYVNYNTVLTDTSDKVAFSMAMKHIDDGEGHTDTVIAVPLRGGGYGGEWGSNFNLTMDGYHGNHVGFQRAADGVRSALADYLTKLKTEGKIKGEVKLWFTGYSRASATANLLAHDVSALSSLGGVPIQRKNVYAYTFATPAGAKIVGKNVDDNIFNIVSPVDLVPRVAPAAWGYGRYGITLVLPTKNDQKLMDTYRDLSGLTGSQGDLAVMPAQRLLLDDFCVRLTLVVPDTTAYRQLGLNEALPKLMGGLLGGEPDNGYYGLDAVMDGLISLPDSVGGTFKKLLSNGLTSSSVARAHHPELYLARLETGGLNTVEDFASHARSKQVVVPLLKTLPGITGGSASGSLGIFVYDSKDNLVCAYEDGVCKNGTAATVEKTDAGVVFTLPDGEEAYTMAVGSRSKGTFSFTVFSYDEDSLNGPARTVDFNDFPMEAGTVFAYTIPAGTDGDYRGYSEDGQDQYQPDYDSQVDGDDRPLDGGPTTTSSFTDVPAGAYYADAVKWAVAEGITSGTTSTTFSPNSSCTRAQMVTFLWRAAGSPEPESDYEPFRDVPKDAYYRKAVLWAAGEGITSGTSATTFSPNATVTRAQTVTFLWRWEGEPEADQRSGFRDVPAGQYYSEAVAWAVEEGITNGTGTTTFSPGQTCTRAQIVTFLWRDMA